MTLDDLIAQARRAHRFRARRADESDETYRAALIEHVSCFDLAGAHELRVGRVMDDWTPDDVALFRELMLQAPKASVLNESVGAPKSGVLIDCGVARDVSDTEVLRLAAVGFEMYGGLREAKPDGIVPIMVHVLLSDCSVKLVVTFSRDDRVGIVKALVEQLPVFGFWVYCDAYIHLVAHETAAEQKATRHDALLAHVGTRDVRKLMVRPYARNPSGVVWLPSQDVSLDKTGDGITHDPYAGVFAMAPPTRPQ